VPVPNNVRYASDSDHSRHESELTLWAIADIERPDLLCRTTQSLSASAVVECGPKIEALQTCKLSAYSVAVRPASSTTPDQRTISLLINAGSAAGGGESIGIIPRPMICPCVCGVATIDLRALWS